MRRASNLWPSVVDYRALLAAMARAARGHRDSAAVAPILERAEFEALALQRELDAGTWTPGPVHRFTIHDPKEREITVAPFRDRVVHHALIAPLEPVFERRMIAHSFACRRGKGAHAALDHAQRMLRRHDHFLKLDIARFFGSVDHDVVIETLRRVVKDRRVLRLCETVLRGPPTCDGSTRGLAIGSLTSQWFANLVLDRLDHVVKERLRVPGYVRYMDDFVLFADDAAALQIAHGAVRAYCADPLRLSLKASATMLAPAHHGLPFLGWMVYRGTRRVRPGNVRRLRWRLRHLRHHLVRGTITSERYRASVAAVMQHVSHRANPGFRSQLARLARAPP